MSLKVFTTFTGIGSPEMALTNLGIDFINVGMSEVDRYALLAYDAIHNDLNEEIEIPSKEKILEEIKDKHIAYNFSTGKSEIPRRQSELEQLYVAHKRNKNYGDIKLIEASSLPDFDLFTYSFPCKNISIAGEQAGLEEGSDTQSSLLWECKKIIETKQPPYLLMENVRNLVSKKHLPDFEKWIEVLKELGYDSYWKILNGNDFDVPQNRDRVIMISIKSELKQSYELPIGELTTMNVEDILEPESDIPDNLYYGKDRFDLNDSNQTERKSKILQIGNVDNKTHANSRIYSSKGFSPTLNAMTGGNRQPKMQIFDKKGNFIVRRLSPLECWRLMGYSDEDFNKAKNIGKLANSKLYERAGRGIVVPMLEKVLSNLFKK